MDGSSVSSISVDNRLLLEAGKMFENMGLTLSSAVNLFLAQSLIQRRLPIDEIVAEPLDEPPADDEYHSFDTWEQAKAWLDA